MEITYKQITKIQNHGLLWKYALQCKRLQVLPIKPHI